MAREWRGKRDQRPRRAVLIPRPPRILTHLRATALHCEACSLYTKSLLHELRVLREASIASCEYYEYKKKMGAEVTAGGFEPATSNKQIPAHLRIASPPREARASFSILFSRLGNLPFEVR